jgi:hypothetical protein
MTMTTARTIDCTDIKALLSGLIDGALDDAARHEAERHLAHCPACSAMLSEAETLDALLAAEAGARLSAGALPEGFAGAVLARTVYAAPPRASARWTGWAGWLAAAAALALALTLWVMDQRRAARTAALPERGGTETMTVRAANLASYPRGDFVRSWTHDGPLPDDAVAAAMPTGTSPDDAMPGASAAAAPPVVLSADDAHAIFAASMLMDTLAAADEGSFRDVEWIRQTAEYDQLLPRLSAARFQLPAADRPVLLAVEGMLHRIVNGPMDLEDVRLMRDAVARLDLSTELATIGDRQFPVRSSL